MIGGQGNDSYYVDDARDIVTEAANGGSDIVYTTLASYTLGANVENLLGYAATAQTLTGNTLDNYIQGGNANDTLNGGDGADRLDGGGGADTMVGGDGNDLYYVDNPGDTTVETATGGVDNVFARDISWTLADNVEHLTLLGTGSYDLTGNGDGNRLTGNDGDNVLDGQAGGDLMFGGKGDDVYIVDQAGDQVFEDAAAGSDPVVSAISYTLGDNVENLVLTGTATSGTGNGLDNSLTGNDRANTLSGGAGNDFLNGGVGADVMKGGDGNDIYHVDDAGDQITEYSNGGLGGVDLVISTISTTLGANLENLTLSGSAAIDGAGNGLANLLTAGDGVNTLTGGGGNDFFTFATAPQANGDKIADFETGDRIDLHGIDANTSTGTDDAFAYIGSGAFTHHAGELQVTYAGGIYTVAGDTDGNGAADFSFAVVSNHALAAGDFML